MAGILATLKGGAMGGRGESSCQDVPTSPFEQAVVRATAAQLEQALAWLAKNPNVHGCAKARQERIRRRLDELATEQVQDYHHAAAPRQDRRYVVAKRPTVVCLCGSTRFYEAFVEANFRETMAGKIVLSVGFFMHRPETTPIHGETVGITPEQKVMLDELHMRKIDLADEVLVLNVGGYIGESTARELAYAQHECKKIRFLESTILID